MVGSVKGNKSELYLQTVSLNLNIDFRKSFPLVKMTNNHIFTLKIIRWVFYGPFVPKAVQPAQRLRARTAYSSH